MSDKEKNAVKNEAKKIQRTLSGKVVSDKMNETVTVLVTRKVKHPLYKKYINRSTKIHAHSKDNLYKIGDEVVIAETKPISKTKSWKVLHKVGEK